MNRLADVKRFNTFIRKTSTCIKIIKEDSIPKTFIIVYHSLPVVRFAHFLVIHCISKEKDINILAQFLLFVFFFIFIYFLQNETKISMKFKCSVLF